MAVKENFEMDYSDELFNCWAELEAQPPGR